MNPTSVKAFLRTPRSIIPHLLIECGRAYPKPTISKTADIFKGRAV